MSKYSFGNGQYVVYAKSEQEARQVIHQELKRFDVIKGKMANLLTENGQEWQKFMDNISEDRLNIYFNDEQSSIYDKDLIAKGEVRQRNISNGEFSYDLAYRYPEIEGHNANFRLAHEMGHLMLNPSKVNQQVYDKTSNSRQVAGLIRKDEETGQFYGEQIQENAINLIAQLAIRGDTKADDIITGKVDLSEFNSYKKCDDLVKLLAVSMRNDFENEMTFEQLVEQKIDSMITHQDGTQEPANTFFYGILNDSSVIENEFNKYLGRGAWRELNEAFTQLYDQNLSKEKFELIFQNAHGLIQEFANIRYQDKYKETVIRNGDFDVPNIENKLGMISEIAGIENKTIGNDNIERNYSQEQNIQMPEGYSINEFGEIIRHTKEERQEQTQNKLTLKQKVAQFLHKNNLFMNLSFVDKFVHQQLDVLPEPNQEIRETNSTRGNFINELTNFGEYRNLPPIQRMSDPRKLEEMRRKMEQNQIGSDTERGR